jgi:T5orf172 domain
MSFKSMTKHTSNVTRSPRKCMNLSLKINFNTRTISAQFHSTVKAQNHASNRCTCFGSQHYHSSPARIKNTHVQRMRFVIAKDEHIRKAQTAIQKAQNQVFAGLETDVGFHLLICELSSLLARWCIGRLSLKMRPFRVPLLTLSAHCDHVLKKVREALTENDIKTNGLGYIYILRSHNPTTQAELKIGFSRFHPQHRSQELARCFVRPEVVAHTQLLPFAKRVEALIHAELYNFRKVQWCASCHRDHQEWFTIAIDHVRRTVARWSKFILLRPYMAGKLNNDVSNRLGCSEFTNLSSEMLDSDSYWDRTVDSVLVDEPSSLRVRQIGIYLNAIWMYRNIQDWTNTTPAWKYVPALQSFDTFYDGYFCSQQSRSEAPPGNAKDSAKAPPWPGGPLGREGSMSGIQSLRAIPLWLQQCCDENGIAHMD